MNSSILTSLASANAFEVGALAVVFVILMILLLAGFAARYKKCPSDAVMVIYGKTGGNRAAKCIHGGAAFIFPVIQDYGFLSLRPMQLDVNLTNALCLQNIRINVPSVFTVGISTDEELMGNAANRLMGLRMEQIAELSRDIILGQLRLVIASMTIEQINSDRETFLSKIESNVADELNKIGLQLLNVNITDITDESGYIDAIGKRAAAEAINRARVEVAEEERKGGIGEAEARKIQRVAVANAEAEAQSGEAEAERQRRVAVVNADAQAQVGEAEANKQRRVAVKQAEAQAIDGENISAIEIAKSNAIRAEKEAEAHRAAEAAKQIAEAQIRQAAYQAEEEAQKVRARMEEERQRADTIVKAKIDKEQQVIAAEAEAEARAAEARGEASAIYQKLEAEAKGNFAILQAKGDGFRKIIEACGDNADAATKMLLIEKLEEIVRLQTEAIKNIKIDKVTVWDGAGTSANGKTSTANFLSGMMQSLPPLHDVANMAGIELPEYLGKVAEEKTTGE